MESAPLTVQGLVLQLPIGKVGWKLFMSVCFSVLGLVEIQEALSRKGGWLVSGSLLGFVIFVSSVGLLCL